MENRFKTELGCEVASNTLSGWPLGAFWGRIGVPNFGPFSQIGDPELTQICLHFKVAFDTVFERFLEAIRGNLGV